MCCDDYLVRTGEILQNAHKEALISRVLTSLWLFYSVNDALSFILGAQEFGFRSKET